MDRREFCTGLAVAAGVGASPAWLSAKEPVKPVRFSFMLWALERQASFDRCVEMVASAGYQGVELVGEFRQWSPEERRRILAKMRGLGMVFDSMSGVKTGFAVPDAQRTFLEELQEHLRAASELECPQVILLSGSRASKMDPETQRAVAIENLKRGTEMAAKQSIEIVIEPIDLLEDPSIFLASVNEGFALAKAVGAPNLKVLYDLYHEQRSFGNLLEKLEQNIDRVGLIHVADVPGRHEPGTGEIDYMTIYRKLAELRYDRWIAMEYYPTGDAVSSLRDARQQAERAMRMTG